MRIHVYPEDVEAARHGIHRSAEWPRFERQHLLAQPKCVCCTPEMRPRAAQQVHHIFPFHYCIALGRPDLELDSRNLITLCEDEAGRSGENHHLLVGHFGSFQSSNLNVEADARSTFHGATAEVIRKSLQWQAGVSKRLKRLCEMSAAEKEAFAKLMSQKLPRK